MKNFFNSLGTLICRLKDLIKRGILRIFPTAEQAYNAFISIQLVAILFTLLLVCCSCGSTKMVTQTVERISVDTVYINTLQQDSIYIFKDRLIDRLRDTIYLKDVSVEYRYKFFHDTLRVVQRDTIPVEVTVTEVKEIQRPLTAYDKACRITFWLVIGFLLSFIAVKFRKGCF